MSRLFFPPSKSRSRLLQEVGEAMYGSQWQSPLARDLDINDRVMRYMAAGARPVPTGVYLDLLRLSQKRAMALDALADRLKAAAAPGTPGDG